ncbi:TIR domain-containing protein, partial [Bathymodiolus thermophilus thioautotrophic gill symbiont]
MLDKVTREFHQKLKDKLENLPESWRDKYRLELWIDQEDMKGTGNIEKQFMCKVQEVNFGIVLFSDKWFNSANCQQEANELYKNQETVVQISLNCDFEDIDEKYRKNAVYPKFFSQEHETLLSLFDSGDSNKINSFFNHIRKTICESLDKALPPKDTITIRLQNNNSNSHIDKVTNKGTESNNSNEKFEVIPKLIQWAKFD